MYNRYVKKTWKERFYYPQVYRRPDYFLSSTDFQTVKFAQAFRIREDQCMNLGYPRNDFLLADESKRMDFIRRFESHGTQQLIQQLRSFSKVLLYMPTWRESQRKLFAEHLDLQRLNRLMKEQNALLLLKPHANTIIENPEQLKAYSNLQLMDNSVDIYPILPYTDVLITDYSSILYDYLLMEEKGVILYLYDYDEYVKDRDFNYPFLENVAGEICYSFDELLAAIGKEEVNRSNYEHIRRKFWGDYSGKATQQLIDKFLITIGKKGKI
jgi:CDP-glycerol glycerophosphotransferase (TagB/SpsB family)